MEQEETARKVNYNAPKKPRITRRLGVRRHHHKTNPQAENKLRKYLKRDRYASVGIWVQHRKRLLGKLGLDLCVYVSVCV